MWGCWWNGRDAQSKVMPDVSSGRVLQRYCHGDKFMLALGSLSLPSTTFWKSKVHQSKCHMLLNLQFINCHYKCKSWESSHKIVLLFLCLFPDWNGFKSEAVGSLNCGFWAASLLLWAGMAVLLHGPAHCVWSWAAADASTPKRTCDVKGKNARAGAYHQ